MAAVLRRQSKFKTRTSLFMKSLLILSFRSSEMERPASVGYGGSTAQNVNEVVEANASVSLVSAFKGGLQLAVLGLGEDAPFLVE